MVAHWLNSMARREVENILAAEGKGRDQIKKENFPPSLGGKLLRGKKDALEYAEMLIKVGLLDFEKDSDILDKITG